MSKALQAPPAPTISKREANYRPQDTPGERCGNCAMFVAGGRCTLVRGAIDSSYTCDHWTASKRARVAKYSDEQLRDEHGRWIPEGGGRKAPAEAKPAMPAVHERSHTLYWQQLGAYGKGQPALTPYDTDEVKGARRLQASVRQTSDIQTPSREKLRQQIADRLYGDGAKTKAREAWIVLGPPAAGKSNVMAKPLAAEHGALLIDSDSAKEHLPEFERGRNAGAVHEESSDIANNRVLARAVVKGDNLVLPLVGKTAANVTKITDGLHEARYKVHLLLNDLPPEKAAQREVARFENNGRFVDPHYVLNVVGTNPRKTYDIVKAHPAIVDYAAYSNDVPRGERPRLLERGEGAAGRARGPGRGGRHLARIKDRAQAAEGGIAKLGGGPPGPFDDALAAHILEQVGIGDWDALARLLVGPLGESAAQGVLVGFADLDVAPDDEAFRLANEDAVDWAAERAAELVGRRRVGPALELVHNAPPWAITESTREGLRDVVRQAVAEGWSADALAEAVQESWVFDAARADMIARTELAMAHVAGTMAAWRRSGVVAGKKWMLSNLHDQDDICDINAEAGTIPLDASFPSGDDGPPSHPNCECVLVAEVLDAAETV